MTKIKAKNRKGAPAVVVQRVVRARQTTLTDIAKAAHKAGCSVSVGLKQKLLYEPRHERLDSFRFKINGGGELGVKEDGEICITFRDGKFEGAKFPFSGNYTRNGWRILAAIESKICDIETRLAQVP